MNSIGKFIANLRRKSFERRINQEITKIFLHMHQRENHGYSFSSRDEMTKEQIRGFLLASKLIRDLEQVGGKMPAAQGEAFRYIAYRDLNARMRAYVKLAEEGADDPVPANHQLARA